MVERTLRRYIPCLSKWPKRDSSEVKGVHIVVGFFFMVNFELGMGFLGIPFSFFHGGILAGVISVAIVSTVSCITSIWILETTSRAQAFTEHQQNVRSTESSRFQFLSRHRKFEISELCGLFLGCWGKYAYMILISVTAFVYMLGYSTVAGSSWAVNLPLNFGAFEQCNNTNFYNHTLPSVIPCRNAYWFSLFLFACIVVPLSMISLKEQAVVQVAMSFLRFTALGMIFTFSVVNVISAGTICACDRPWRTNTSEVEQQCNINSTISYALFHYDFEAWTVAIPVMVSATTLQTAIPALTYPVRQKRHLRGLVVVIYIVFTVVYSLLGLLIPMWWRNCINETCTLNWGPLTHFSFNMALRAFSYFIVIFPSVDILTAYPIACLLMVNNMYTAFGGKDSAEASKKWSSFIVLLAMKFISSLVPILVAMAVSNLVTVLKYSGFVSFFHSFIVPVVIQFSSQWVCYKTFKKSLESRSYALQESSGNGAAAKNEERSQLIETTPSVKPSDLYMTPYSTIFSHWPTGVVVGGVATALLGLTVNSFFNTDNY